MTTNGTERGHIRNPVEWTVDGLRAAGREVRGPTQKADAADVGSGAPEVRRIALGDLWQALSKGASDFGACRTDIIFICIIYPVAGLILARVAIGYDLLPLVFPLASGFTLLGPIAAVGLYEMSRRRELGHRISWVDAFGVLNASTLRPILALGAILLAVFLAWLAVAYLVYALTLGPEAPTSLIGFARDVLTTPAGWTMIVVGCGAGLVFAVLVFAISVVSFPLLLDRHVTLLTAIATSVRAVRTNTWPMTVWGLIVAGMLVLGSLPALLGLIVVMPILGHASWHLYRRAVVAPAEVTPAPSRTPPST